MVNIVNIVKAKYRIKNNNKDSMSVFLVLKNHKKAKTNSDRNLMVNEASKNLP